MYHSLISFSFGYAFRPPLLISGGLFILSLTGNSLTAQALELSELDGSNGFVINGIDISDQSGRSLSALGDINKDGVRDLLIGAPLADPGEINASGESYVVFGSSSQNFPAMLELSELDGSNGFVINGIADGDQAGWAVSGLGDINDDDIDDLIIGARFANDDKGASYVVFGSDQDFDPVLDLSDLDGSNGFVINGINSGDQSGSVVSGLGDINGDMIDDLIISAFFASPNNNNNSGESYVVFGSADFGSTQLATLELSNLDGSNGFVIRGIDADDLSGRSISGINDINGDDIPDLVLAAPGADPGDRAESGETYIIFGRSQAQPFDAVLDLSDLDGENGFVINGVSADQQTGIAVSGLGDINSDGINDLIIGMYNADDFNDTGTSYVVFGSDQFGTTQFTTLELSDLDGSNGFVINGIDAGDHAGETVSGLGDVNGDGIDDILVGAYQAAAAAGESYVVFGRPSTSPFPAVLELSILGNDLSNDIGYVINGVNANDRAGIAIDGGDINKDQLGDIIIGAFRADSSTGKSYVVFGAEPDSMPDEFMFTDIINASLFTLQRSEAITVTGINIPAEISISNGEYSINGEPYTDIPGTVKKNDSIIVQHTSATTMNTKTTTELDIGGIKATFSSTTFASQNIFSDQFED